MGRAGVVWQPLRQIKWMIVHDTGGDPFEPPQSMADRIPGWPIYHWLVYPEGRIVRIEPPSRMVYHVTGHNFGTLSVAVTGDFSDGRVPPESQRTALESLFHYARHALPCLTTIIGHGELEDRACPGEAWKEWLAQFRAENPVANSRRVSGVGPSYLHRKLRRQLARA